MGIFLKHSCVRVVCIITFFTSLCVVDHTHIFNSLNEYTLKHIHNRYAFRKNDPHEDSDCVVFWDTTSKEVFVKYISRVISIRSSGDMCVIASGTDDGSGQFELTLCNAIGNPVDSKRIDIEPLLVTMTEYKSMCLNFLSFSYLGASKYSNSRGIKREVGPRRSRSHRLQAYHQYCLVST